MRQGWPMIHGCRCKHHHPAGGGAVGIKPVEPVAPKQVHLVDGPAAVEVDVVVVEVGVDAERIEFARFRRHLVGLLVVAPVADIADALGGQQIGRVGSSPGSRARTSRSGACRSPSRPPRSRRGYRRSSSSDMPMWMICRRVRPCAMNSAPRFCSFGDQGRIVVGDGLVERQGRRDSVLVQHRQDAEDADTVAVFVVAVAADIGKARLVAGPQALGTAHRGHGQAASLPGSSQSQCSRLTMTASATRASSGHLSTGRVTMGDQG